MNIDSIPDKYKIHVRDLAFAEYDWVLLNQQKYLVEFDDGAFLPMHASHIKLSYPYWGMTRRYSQVPIKSDICYNYHTEVNEAQHKYLCNRVVAEARNVGGIDKEDIWDILYVVYDDAYNLATDELIQYASTIDFLDIDELLTDPDIASVIKNIPPTADGVSNAHRVIAKVINENRYPHNGIVVAVRNKNVKMDQALQMIVRGRTTEVNSVIWNNPIVRGFATFFDNIADYVKEMTSATKSFVYNDGYIAMSEYFSRKMQLLVSSITHLVPGDCGTKEYLSFPIPNGEVGRTCIDRLKGVYYLDPVTGKEVMFQGKEDLIGKTVKIRTTLSCRHLEVQGVCEKCYGDISWNLCSIDSPGHVSIIAVCKDAVQGILSVKHLDFISWLFTVTLLSGQSRYFSTNPVGDNASKLFVKADLETDRDIRIRVLKEDIPSFANINYVTDNMSILNTSEISSIQKYWIDIYDDEGTVAVSDEFSGIMQGVPASFSQEFLEFLKRNPSFIMEEEGNYTSFKLTGFNSKDGKPKAVPIFEYQQRHESMPVYVENLEKILRSSASRDKLDVKRIIDFNGATEEGCSQAILAIHTYLERKLPGVLISHIATILASLRCKSKIDPSIPHGFNNPNVTFARHDDIMPLRDIGAFLPYERQNDPFLLPGMFLNDKRLNSLLDSSIFIPELD